MTDETAHSTLTLAQEPWRLADLAAQAPQETGPEVDNPIRTVDRRSCAAGLELCNRIVASLIRPYRRELGLPASHRA
jgi:hypothetical protein